MLDEAPAALAGLVRVAERTRQTGASDATTLRLGSTPLASFDTLPALFAAAENGRPNLTVATGARWCCPEVSPRS